MILSPEEYSSASTHDLLAEAARGYVPLDRRFLQEILGRGESVLSDFTEFVKEPRDDDRMEMEQVLVELARHLRTPAALPFLAELARANEFSFPDELTWAFVDLGAAGIGMLIDLYEEGKGASDAAFALAGLGVRDPRIRELLIEHLRSDPIDAAIMLGLYADPETKSALEKALAEAGENSALRRELESALKQIDREDTSAPEPFDIFPLYPEEEFPHFAAFEDEELLGFVKSPVAAYRARAVNMLAFDGPQGKIAETIFELAQRDPDSHVRASAWESLEGVHEPVEIEQALRSKLADAAASSEERAAALVSLAHEARDDEKLHRLILEFYEDPGTRAQAVKAMWHSVDRRFEKEIAKAFDDPDLEVRRQAITAAGVFSMVPQLGRIERCFEDAELREAALYSYALAAPSVATPARMRKLFSKVEDLADGLTEEEAALVGKALDDRLEANEYDPIFLVGDAAEGEEEDELAENPPVTSKVGRNDPCPCGSGKKYKKCCGN